MSTYSMAEAEKNLPDLVNRALRGEDVVITREGAPVVEMRPVQTAGAAKPLRIVTQADLDWLEANTVKPAKPQSQTGAELIRAMRDEGP